MQAPLWKLSRSLVNKIVHNMNVAGPTKLHQEALITNLQMEALIFFLDSSK